jgi:site-specific DNA recombinase
VREIFYLYVERGLSVRQIALWLRERGIPSPTGRPIWGTSTIDRLLRNEAYIGTMYYNRHESIPGNGPRGAPQPQDPPTGAPARGMDRDSGAADRRS